MSSYCSVILIILQSFTLANFLFVLQFCSCFISVIVTIFRAVAQWRKIRGRCIILSLACSFSKMLLGFLCFSVLFWLKVADQSHFRVSSCALRVPGPVRDYSCKLFSNKFIAHANVKCLLILLLLFCPIHFEFVNSCSIRNKGYLIGDTIVSNNLNISALAETHIPNSDTDTVLKSITPPCFQLIVASLLGKTYLQRLLMHQHIPLSKALSYELSLIQNHLLWLVSITPQVHLPLIY